jgi:uncharacterized membrane protein
VSARLPAIQLGILLCTGSLLALLGLQRFLVDPLGTAAANLVVFALQVAPLLAVTFAVLRLTPRCAFWAALVSLVYLGHGLLQIFTLEGRMFGIFEVAFALALFALGFRLSHLLRTLRATVPRSDAGGWVRPDV